MNTGDIIESVTIDMRKAFDIINFDILIEKLKTYGCDETIIKWFNSYISKRKQYVLNEGYKSEFQKTKHRIAQGCILGPLIFILYVNEFFICITVNTACILMIQS